MKQKIFIIGLVAFCAGFCFAQPTGMATNSALSKTDVLPFVEKRDLDFGTSHGYATLSVEKTVISSKDDFLVEIRFFNTGEGRYFFNPFFDSLIARPAQIALYDSNHNYIGNLIESYSGSMKLTSSEDWIFIPTRASTGIEMQLKPTVNLRSIPPGDYYLQVIFYEAFIASNPAESRGNVSLGNEQSRLESSVENFDRNELFRSNPVKVTITKN
jgi:hypothetical protein